MLIGQISELSGYSHRMIRYLEDQGFLVPQRSDSNLRQFSDGDLTQILKIKRFKELGFTYPEIKGLIQDDEGTLAQKGSELLKRHHADAHELTQKIQRLEAICYGQVKTTNLPEKVTTLSHPPRTAYRIKKMGAVSEYLERDFPDCKSEVILWKFGEFINMQETFKSQEIEVVEIFRGSSQIVILNGAQFLMNYEKAWAAQSLPLNVNPMGIFPLSELSEFFGNYEIVIEHKMTNVTGEVLLHALLPYQAVFIASGESSII